MTKMKLPEKVQSGDVEIVDLSSDKVPSSSNSLNVNPDMNFLNNLAVAKKEDNFVQSPGPITDNLRKARKNNLKSVLNEIKLKMEDTDYKLNDVVTKVRDIDRRLADLERR